MKDRHILVLGFFGYVSGMLCGQTVKTRQIYKLLQQELSCSGSRYKIDFFDTQILQESRFKLFSLLVKVLKAKIVVYLPGQNNLSGFFRILYAVCRVFRKEVLYVMIGGWLPDFLKDKPDLAKKLSKIKAVFPENKDVKLRLENEYGFRNVEVLPNFRFSDAIGKEMHMSEPTTVFRLAFMSRITEAKGVFTVLNVLEKLEKRGVKVMADFYGPMDGLCKENFMRRLSVMANAEYKRRLQPKDIPIVLTQYDAMILPTFYEGEGFPGAVIDAYMAAIPVLISDWKYNGEYVRNGETGFLVPLDNKQEDRYAEIIEHLATDSEALKKMKANAAAEAEKYSEKAAWKILQKYFK